MTDTCFFAITTILICWILTIIAFFIHWRRQRQTAGDKPTPFSLLLNLADEKSKEARDAAERLLSVADTIGIGLIELKGGRIKRMNEMAHTLLAPIGEDETHFQEFIGSNLQKGPVSLEIGKNMLQFTNIPQRNDIGILLIQDVTETFLMGKKLKSQEKLALLGKMSAQMAHQIKTPLSIMAGAAQMLARGLDGNPALRQKAVDLYEDALRLARRINEIARFYSGSAVQMVDADIESTLRLVKARLGEKAGGPAVSVECRKGLTLHTDPGLLSDIVFLLGQNALEPDIKATGIWLKASVQGADLVITVEDDGLGVPEELRESIFEPFTGANKDGLGLGLFLAKDIAEKLGAAVCLRKDKGPHTCFELRFPSIPSTP
ncbi:MAG: HAMP domain-containing sensor histidine kinase [Desulfobacteraceae bacterium]|nr:HAMP domain-containing sensor histidine kinase [Desulfobacteraceae bacterium]